MTIQPFDIGTYLVTSERDATLRYAVDVRDRTCTCDSFLHDRSPVPTCKHLEAVLAYVLGATNPGDRFIGKTICFRVGKSSRSGLCLEAFHDGDLLVSEQLARGNRASASEAVRNYRRDQSRMKTSTLFSHDRRYRYTLWREWGIGALGLFDHKQPPESYLMVIGLNPSTADETNDDPTIRRCISFAKRWGFGALCMTNLFALRATDPEIMKADGAPVGDSNDEHLFEIAKDAGMILAAWGKDGRHKGRAEVVLTMLESFEIHALAINKDGTPKHPLYVRADTVPLPIKRK